LVSTFDEFARGQGTYSDREACLADLPNEVRLFERKTGLSSVTAFCFSESSLSNDNLHPFIARVDGFGMPSLRPFVFDASIYAAPANSAQELEEIISESLAGMSSVEEPRLRVDYASALPRTVVKYYSTRERALALDTMVSFENINSCHQYQSDFDALLSEFGLIRGRSFCASERFSSVAHHYYFGLVAGAFSSERVPQSFMNRQLCESSLPNIVAQYTSSTGSSFVKGFCSYERTGIWSNYTYFAKVLIEQ
jgi:hypothetical protein